MNNARHIHTISVLTNGKVLVTGGYNVVVYLNTAELYNPYTEVWTMTGSMTYARYMHTISIVSNGRLLVAGGEGNNGIL